LTPVSPEMIKLATLGCIVYAAADTLFPISLPGFQIEGVPVENKVEFTSPV
jgi:hypothetical protein